MLRECRRLTPSSNSRYGPKKFFSPRDSRFDSSFFMSPRNSKGHNSSREDDSPLRRKILARNERQASTGIENLFASDFSTVKRIHIETEQADEIKKQKEKQVGGQKFVPIKPSNAEKRAINRMFNKKSPEVEPEVKQVKNKTKTDVLKVPKIKMDSPENSFLSRLQ